MASAFAHRITFCVQIFRSERDRGRSERFLQAALDLLTLQCELWLSEHPEAPDLYDSGVRYMREPPGREDWQDTGTTIDRRFGDCEDLSCWRAAELRVRDGIEASAFAEYRGTFNGVDLYHIRVRFPDGRIEDPSAALGMPT